MLKNIDWKATFTQSITFGMVAVSSLVFVMIFTGFAVALHAEGDAILVAARTITYPMLPYVLFMVAGFALFHSSRRTPLLPVMFNLFAVVLFVAMVSILLLGVVNMDDVLMMWKDVLLQNFVLSVIVFVMFVLTTFIKEPVLEVAKRSSK